MRFVKKQNKMLHTHNRNDILTVKSLPAFKAFRLGEKKRLNNRLLRRTGGGVNVTHPINTLKEVL